MGRVADYIHLNAPRAGLVPVSRLEQYRYSSLWYLARARPPWLRFDWVLQHAGVTDSPVGWAGYRRHLEALHASRKPGGPESGSMSRGWVIGSSEFKSVLLRDHAVAALSRAWETQGAQEIREREWEELFQRAMRCLRRHPTELAAGPKNASWKIAIALFLKERSQASNRWLAQRLGIGRPQYLSRLASARRRSGAGPRELEILKEKCSA